MKFFLTIAYFFLFNIVSAQHLPDRPKVGLTLSGGGAKGLAHIGILKAIDSAGLKIDYITGTSMGAVLGALYAVGYSGKQIEDLCKLMEWDMLLSNQLPLRALSMEEKDQYARFIVELPYINKKIKLPTGVIQGQELSVKLSDLFFMFTKQETSMTCQFLSVAWQPTWKRETLSCLIPEILLRPSGQVWQYLQYLTL